MVPWGHLATTGDGAICNDGSMTPLGNTVQVLGRPFICHVCGYDRFIQREIQLQTPGMAFFDLDWLNQSADSAICNHCGYVHMFFKNAHTWSE